VGRQFYRHFYASVGLGYVDNQSSYNDDYNETTIGVYYNDQYSKLSGFVSAKFDNTDDYYTPREGFIAAINLEYAQLDGDMLDENIDRGYSEFDDFTKVNARFGAYYGLNDWIDYDLILRFKARYTKIISQNDEYIPIAERLFMGGIGSVRGMRLAFFYDYGIIRTDSVLNRDGSGNIDFNDPDVSQTGDSVARSSTGVVLEWQSGFGPINLVFSYPLDEKSYDETATFEFSMGTKF
jgi:outer membrane protein insertion porin family